MYRPGPGRRGCSRPQGRAASRDSDAPRSCAAGAGLSRPAPRPGHGAGEALGRKHRRRVLELPARAGPQHPAARPATRPASTASTRSSSLKSPLRPAADPGAARTVRVRPRRAAPRPARRHRARSGRRRARCAASHQVGRRAARARGGAAASPAHSASRTPPGHLLQPDLVAHAVGVLVRAGRHAGAVRTPATPARPAPCVRRRRMPGRAWRPAAASSSTVPFEQIGQSAVKRLWRQKSGHAR